MTVKKNIEGKETRFKFNGQEFELSERQKLFCMEYVRNNFNGTQAAIKAGYAPKSAVVAASRLLIIDNISAFISALKKDLAFCIGISAIDIAREYAKVGFSDVRKIFDENGNLIVIKDIPDDAAANIASIEVFEEYQGQGSNKEFIGNTKKVKFYDKVNALDKLAKMIGADGVTKIASTDTDGNDVSLKIGYGKKDD